MDDLKSDRAEMLKSVRTIPDGEFNYEVTITAVKDGIEIEPLGLFISWDWIDQSRSVLASCDEETCSS